MERNMASENNFWDVTWSSEKLKRGTEMLDIEIPSSCNEFIFDLLGDINGKKVLDIGCGSGILTMKLCKKGAFVTAIDLSEEGVKATREISQKNNINKIIIKQMNAEELQFDDDTFDVVYISRMLVHTDQDKVLRESVRVLNQGGILVLCEPLKYWLFGTIYRTFSPYRKAHPRYFTINDVKKIGANHKEFYVFSTLFFFLFYINKKSAFSVFRFVEKFDKMLLALFPSLGNVAWLTVAWVRK